MQINIAADMPEHKLKVSSKGQVVIPEEARNEYGIKTGSKLTLKLLDEKRLILEKVPKLSELFGFLGEAKTAELVAKESEKESKVEREGDENLRRVVKGPKSKN